jgi:hypothetical protein
VTHARRAALIGLLVLVAAAPPAGAAPLDSDLADARRGGGCHPTGRQPSVLDMLVLINPEWAPVTSGQTVDSDPVLISGTVDRMHGETGGDFPSTHVLSDVVMDVRVDPEHEDKVATGNDEEHVMLFEWEAGKYPDWAWPGLGDHIWGLGRHIFDCGHPGARFGRCSATTGRECVLDGDCRPPLCSACGAAETCEGEHFAYSSELHPPHATAVIRTGRGAPLSGRAGATARPATIADVWASPDGGGAGDRCVLEHRASEADQLVIECFPLREPVAKLNAKDFVFALPLPPKPVRAGKPRWRLLPPPASSDPTATPGETPARLRVRKRLGGDTPHLEVSVRLARKVRGSLPTGFAGRVVAGWNRDRTPLTRVRVTVSALVVDNDLQRAAPLVPKTCSVSDDTPCATSADCPAGESCWGAGPVRGWRGQVAVNGEWRRFSGSGLDEVVDGAVVPQSIVVEEYLPADGALRVQADAFARECIHTLYGQPLADGLEQFGLIKGIQCLGLDEAHVGGRVDVTYAGPEFGAGESGSQSYETRSVGGEGGACSVTTSTLCVVDEDCPGGETCATTGGAFRLRYTIERVS